METNAEINVLFDRAATYRRLLPMTEAGAARDTLLKLLSSAERSLSRTSMSDRIVWC